jgi:hypothetical protein
MSEELHSTTFNEDGTSEVKFDPINPDMYQEPLVVQNNEEGTTEPEQKIDHIFDVMHAEMARFKELNGFPPLIMEYCANPDTENEANWESIPPPFNGYKRTPPNLLEYGPEKLVGRTITCCHIYAHTYGSGGHGWVSLDLDAEGPPLVLIYCLWGADRWIKFTPHTPQSHHPISWKIQSVELSDRLFEIRAIDQETLTETVIRTDDIPIPSCRIEWSFVAKRGNGESQTLYKIGELWHACRPDGNHWCS